MLYSFVCDNIDIDRISKITTMKITEAFDSAGI